MAYRRRKRGLGAAGDAATPDVPAGPCGTGYAWAIPDCWQWPKAIMYGSNYVNPPMPAVVGSTLPDGSVIPVVPANAAAAGDTVQAITNQQILDTQAQNQAFFENLNPIVNPAPGIPWWVWLAGGLGAAALVFVGGGSPRRYGR